MVLVADCRSIEKQTGPSIWLSQVGAIKITPGPRGSLLIHIHKGVADEIAGEYTGELEWEQD